MLEGGFVVVPAISIFGSEVYNICNWYGGAGLTMSSGGGGGTKEKAICG